MINMKFIICTECQKTKKRKAKQFSSFRNLNIHLKLKHNTKYRIRAERSDLRITRIKHNRIKNNLH